MLFSFPTKNVSVQENIRNKTWDRGWGNRAGDSGGREWKREWKRKWWKWRKQKWKRKIKRETSGRHFRGILDASVESYVKAVEREDANARVGVGRKMKPPNPWGWGLNVKQGKKSSRVIKIQSGSSGHDGWSGPTPNSGNLELCEWSEQMVKGIKKKESRRQEGNPIQRNCYTRQTGWFDRE